jgi:hypothetical protein
MTRQTIDTERSSQPARVPTRFSSAKTRAKAFSLQTGRAIKDIASNIDKLRKEDPNGFPQRIAKSRSKLWTETAIVEARFQFGKVQNLRRAIRELDCVLLPAGQTFSFWKQIGRATGHRGFVEGRMLQEGCIIPAIGGGLCQLSNALYDAALQADCEIVERHAHTQIVPGSAAAQDRDATVAWNYIDLRFRSRIPLLIRARLTHDDLLVDFFSHEHAGPASAAKIDPPRNRAASQQKPLVEHAHPRTCTTCNEANCFRFEPERPGESTQGRTVFLLDENWPEFLEYASGRRHPRDIVGVPFNSARWNWHRYNYELAGCPDLQSASLEAFGRAIATRRWSTNAPRRRMAELECAADIAEKLARLLTADVTTICTAQSFVPFLWDRGHIGGRELQILMTRLPMAVLHQRLDAAYEKHPQRNSLADFRAPSWIVKAEEAAIDYADAIVTPHSEIADILAKKVHKLAWQKPARLALGAPVANRITFPGPTIARKGCYEVREAALALGLEVSLGGKSLEGPNFWSGVRTLMPSSNDSPDAWLEGVAAVVQPALVEENPRRLLKALSCGVPVIATRFCGLEPREGLHIVSQVDTTSLVEALQEVLGNRPAIPENSAAPLAHA